LKVREPHRESSCGNPLHYRLNYGKITIEQTGNVEANNSHKFFNLFILLAFKAEFFSECLAEAFVSDSNGLLNFLFDDVLVEELGEGLGNLSFHEFGDALEGIGGALELVEIF